MIAHGVTPILNVSNFAESIAWFERLGRKKLWDWGDPPSFGAVGSGKVEIFLCHDGQGGRGKGTNTETFTADEQRQRRLDVRLGRRRRLHSPTLPSQQYRSHNAAHGLPLEHPRTTHPPPRRPRLPHQQRHRIPGGTGLGGAVTRTLKAL